MKRNVLPGSIRALRVLLCAVMMVAALLPCLTAAALQRSNYTQVYEPATSLPLAATVCWRADTSAEAAAAHNERPASALVYVDASLRVLNKAGEEIAPRLEEYLNKTATSFIPVLYPMGDAAAQALQGVLVRGDHKDVFVAAAYQNAGWIKGFSQIPHIRGLVDFTDMEVPGEEALLEIIQITNRAGAKVALLDGEAVTRERIRFLQSRLVTVWAKPQGGRVSLLGALTAGVNGLVVDDYAAAYEAIGFFRDDAPSMLRVPIIAGHRGMPSEHIENTLPSALAASYAGADVIESDIWLSRDGELFINHDKSLKRLYGRGDIPDSEALTLSELQAIPFSHEGMSGVPIANNQPAAKSRYGYIRQEAASRIPAMREYYDTFRETDIVHFVEIKSNNPAIVSVLKAMAGQMGTAGQTVVITFHTAILKALRQEWPEVSVGALGTQGANTGDGQPGFLDYAAIARSQGAEMALELLTRVLGPYNATYNPRYNFTYDIAVVGRHRGLTVWPWTYNDPALFADAWLGGVYGLTTNFAWWATDFVTTLQAGNEQLAVGALLPQPMMITQSGTVVQARDAQAITLSGSCVSQGVALRAGDAVCLWRLKRSLVIDGVDYGAYYLYSEPFLVSVQAE